MTMTSLELISQKLPHDYVIAIISNMDDKQMLDDTSNGSILDEIECLFDWCDSHEGSLFWSNVVESIKNGKPLPPLPFKTIWKPNTYVSLKDGSYLMNYLEGGRKTELMFDINLSPKNYNERFCLETHLSFCN